MVFMDTLSVSLVVGLGIRLIVLSPSLWLDTGQSLSGITASQGTDLKSVPGHAVLVIIRFFLYSFH